MVKDLPNQFDHQRAGRWYEHWEQKGYFESEPDPDRKPFTIVIPPPNVTGALHLGHALNNSLQDIVIRFKRMQGFNALWVPGTDHAGIATQAVVERRLLEEEGQTRHDLGREKLVERIWAWKDQYEARILGQLKQMGCSCDWRRTRFTLDEICARAVRFTFFDLFTKGLIYRGKRLVNWDTFLRTTVSDDELFTETVRGHFWHFRYPVIDPQDGEPEHVEIATTRPETMLGDTAVAVHPDPVAALDKAEQELKERLDKAPAKEKPELQTQLEELAARRTSHLPTLKKLAEMAKDGRQVMLPLLEREIPLVLDEWAKPELGTGCVKITPAHDPNDYEVGLRQDLPMINILNPDGTLNHNAGPYEGLSIQDARRRVVQDLDEAGLLGEIQDRDIELKHSDRSKTAIEPFLADQWFVKMDDLAQTAMDAVTDGRVEIIPPRYAKSYLDWLGEKRDWPIGRQLWWGHRIPVWSQDVPDKAAADALIHTLKNDPLVVEGRVAYQLEINEERAAAENRGGEEAAVAIRNLPYAAVHVCLREDADDKEIAPKLEQAGYVQDEDVLDTWFSSALWPHSTLGWPEQTPSLEYYYPTSVLITSRDIITLWVARMVLTGLNNVGDIPFHQVYIHPKILDGDGETMSKSKGNGVDPLDVIEKAGADALRFAIAYLTTETQDVKMPVEFECPHCHELVPQTKKNRTLPRVKCNHCKEEFSTQWAEKEADQALPRGTVTSDRFELARNFSNKLWNASRFALMNLEGYSAALVSDDELEVEDKWLLSRLASVTQKVTKALKNYRFSEAARTLYDFAWDEFCSFYVEMVKARLQDEASRPTAQRVLAYALDTLLRLLHPMMPFLTDEVWHLLGEVAPERGLSQLEQPPESAMIAAWPQADTARISAEIEAQFSCFQKVLQGIRDIRSRQGISPKETVPFVVRCEPAAAELIKPMEPYFASMAKAKAQGWGPDVEAPTASATFACTANSPDGETVAYEVLVDLQEFLDVDAEIDRKQKELENLGKLITGKEKKLSNENFVNKAPADVVQAERDRLAELQQQMETLEAALEELRKLKARG